MSTIATTDFTAADGAAWPNLSNGAAWAYATEGNAFSVAPARSVLSNQGKTLATANATLGNRSWERANISNTATDALISVVVVTNVMSEPPPAMSAGIFLRKAGTNLYYYVYASKLTDSKGLGYSLKIAKQSPVSTFTVLAGTEVSGPSFLDAGPFVLQAKIVPSGTGVIIAARAWSGTDPTTPLVSWRNSGQVAAATFFSVGVTDATPLTGNLNGLIVLRKGASGATTFTFVQFAYYDQAPLVIQDWSNIASAELVAGTRSAGRAIDQQMNSKPGGIASAETVAGLRLGAQGIWQAMTKVGGIASSEAFGGVIRLDQLAGSVGGIGSAEQFGGATLGNLVKIGSITTGEAFGGAVLSNVFGVGSILSAEQVAGVKSLIQQAASFNVGSVASGELVAGVKGLTNLGTLYLYPGSIASAEAFGAFTIFKRGGTVIAAHTLTGVVVASSPTVTGLVATLETITGSVASLYAANGTATTVESLTGAVASTHLLSP